MARAALGDRVIEISFEATIEPPVLTVTELMPYPLATVWIAETEGLYVSQWWAPSEYENLEVDLSLEPGAPWRVTQRDPEGNQYALYGRVESVEAPTLLTMSIVSELYPESEIKLRQEFVAREGGTIVLSTYTFASEDALNTYLAIGGTERLRGASARLNTLLAQLVS